MLTFTFKTGLTSKIDGHKQTSKVAENADLQKCTHKETDPR